MRAASAPMPGPLPIGLRCEESVLDGYWERDASLTELHRFKVSGGGEQGRQAG